jgi:porin
MVTVQSDSAGSTFQGAAAARGFGKITDLPELLQDEARGMRGDGRSGKLRGLLGLIAVAIVAGGGSVAQAEDKAKQPASIWEQETLTGDWGGARSALKAKGIDIGLSYIAETFAVLSGGLRQRASFEGRIDLAVDTDLEKLVGWKGASTNVTVFQIHNGGFNVADNVGSIADPSNIDALATTRLFNIWFQQNFFDDRISVRVGQLGIDLESFTSMTSGGLINGTFGWPGIFAANMINGGPAYPLASPGVRVLIKPTEDLTVLAAVLSGDPAGHNCNDNPQVCNRYGTTFSFSGGALWIGELQYAINQGKDTTGLPGVYKLGAWYETADFADQHFGLNGVGTIVSHADPTVVNPLNHRGNWGIFGMIDQTVWRQQRTSLSLFVRGSVSPSDRNLISFYVDGGAGIKGLFPGRAEDVLTFGVAYAKISRDAVALDQDTLAINGPPYPIRNEEAVLELSYQAQIAPWWILQPDLQYIVHPGGNVPDPNDPNVTLGNAFIAGIRSTIKF